MRLTSFRRSPRRLLTFSIVALMLLSWNATGVANAAQAGPRVRGQTPRVVSSGQAQFQSAVASNQLLRFSLVLQPQRQDELQQFLNEVMDPRSPRFRQFLTFDQWKSRYAPSDQQVASVVAWAHTNGLTVVHQFGDNLGIKVEGSTAAINRAFDVQLNHYRVGSRTFYSNDRDPAIPQNLSGVLKDVQGLNDYFRVQPANPSFAGPPADEPMYKAVPFIQEQTARVQGNRAAPRSAEPGADAIPQICCGQTGFGLELPDLYSSEAYDYAALERFSPCCNPNHVADGAPRETAIAIIGTNTTDPNDLNTFAAQYGLAMHLTEVKIDGPSCCDGEMTLDIETATAMANSFGSYLDSAHVIAYQGGGTKLSDLLDAWQEAHSRDEARVASTSFGKYEDGYGGLFNPSISDFTDEINAMAASGWSIAAAAGDHGAYDDCENLSVNFPASSPNVVAVGGTTLTLTNNSGKPKFSSEVSWTGNGCGGSDWPGSNNGGGGGGCSNTEPAGFWQQLVKVADQCGGKRALPDISLNSGTGAAIYWLGKWNGVGGTSIAAPEFAGFLARENGYLLHLGNVCGDTFNQPCAPLGNPNAMIWLMGFIGTSASGHNPFYDVTSGCNGGSQGQGYCTLTGYDLATGWGSVNVLQLAWAFNDVVSHGVIPQVTFSGATANTWYNSDRQIQFSIVSPSPQGTNASVGLAGYTAQWDATVADVTSHATPGSSDSFYDGPKTQGSSGALGLAGQGVGCHTAHVRAWDNAGETTSDQSFGPVCYDNQPPVVACGKSDGVWHATDVSINCLAFDESNLSGLADPADASFSLSTSVPVGTETANAATNSHQVCDVAGNCVTAGPVTGNQVDKKAPSISITSPTATTYTINQAVTASYSCADGGSGLASCAGPVASGSAVDTQSVGTKTFTVNAADKVNNTSSQSVGYSVTYRICLQYDPSRASSARAYAFTIQLCDANNVNVSNVNIVVTATGVDGVARRAVPLGSLNPNNAFLYGPGTAPGASYLYNLDTQGLASGTHVLNFTVQGDPIPHTAPFLLKR